MKETMRRLLSLVLAWIMLVGVMPTQALAEGGRYCQQLVHRRGHAGL